MADTDFVTEASLNALVTAILADSNSLTNLFVKLEIGSVASTARTAGDAVQYWFCDFGIVPTNAIPGDLIFNRPA